MGAAAFLLILLAGAPGNAAQRDYAVTAAPAEPRVQRSRTALPEGTQFSTEVVTLERPRGSSVTMLRSLPVIGGINVGVGFFSVVGATEREHVRRRTDPSHAIRSRDSRVAAVGMSLRF